jgi:transposase
LGFPVARKWRLTAAAKAIKDLRRATRKQYSAEEKIRIVLDGLRGEASSLFL